MKPGLYKEQSPREALLGKACALTILVFGTMGSLILIAGYILLKR